MRVAKGKKITAHDLAEIEKFKLLLRRRAAHPDEPQFHSYAETYGDVVFEDRGGADEA